MGLVVAGLASAGCDQGTQQNQPVGAGGPIRVVAQYPAENQPLATDGRIELAFNRYLLPFSVSRQTFQLRTGSGQTLTPTVSYDPVARIVTITAPAGALQADQSAVLTIAPGALQAIDGAGLDPAQVTSFNFPVVASTGATPTLPQVDYCRDISPLLQKCIGCHSNGLMYEGLNLQSPQTIAATAVGKAAHGANTGTQSAAQSPGTVFGVDTPIIDPGDGPTGGGNPGNSWLMYKLLLAVPPSMTSATYANPPTDVTQAHLALQPALSDEANDPERANLANAVLGREMPLPYDLEAGLDQNMAALTVDELERVSLWIANTPNGGPVGGSVLLPSGPCQ